MPRIVSWSALAGDDWSGIWPACRVAAALGLRQDRARGIVDALRSYTWVRGGGGGTSWARRRRKTSVAASLSCVEDGGSIILPCEAVSGGRGWDTARVSSPCLRCRGPPCLEASRPRADPAERGCRVERARRQAGLLGRPSGKRERRAGRGGQAFRLMSSAERWTMPLSRAEAVVFGAGVCVVRQCLHEVGGGTRP